MNDVQMILTVTDAARLLGKCRATVYKLIGEGKLRRKPYGKRKGLLRRDVERLAEKGWRD